MAARHRDQGRISWSGALFIPALLAAGLATDWVGGRQTVFIGSLLASALVMSLSRSRETSGIFPGVLLACGEACLAIGTAVLMPEAFTADNPTASMNLGMLFVALGGLLGGALCCLWPDWRLPGRFSIIIALVCLVPAILAALTGQPERLAGSSSHGANPGIIVAAALVLALVYPLEALAGDWSQENLGAGTLVHRGLAFALSFLSSRLLFAYLCDSGIVPRGTEAWAWILLAVAAAVLLGNMASEGLSQTALAFAALGLLLGPLQPTLFGILFDSINPGERGSATGFVLATGAASAMGLTFTRACNQGGQANLHIMLWLALLASGAALALALLPE
jgi:MFS family permease